MYLYVFNLFRLHVLKASVNKVLNDTLSRLVSWLSVTMSCNLVECQLPPSVNTPWTPKQLCWDQQLAAYLSSVGGISVDCQWYYVLLTVVLLEWDSSPSPFPISTGTWFICQLSITWYMWMDTCLMCWSIVSTNTPLTDAFSTPNSIIQPVRMW